MPEKDSLPEVVCVFDGADGEFGVIAQTILSEAGIWFFISGKYPARMMGVGPSVSNNLLARPGIMVASADAPRARKLLKDLEKETRKLSFTGPPSGPSVKKTLWYLALVYSIFLAIELLPTVIGWFRQ